MKKALIAILVIFIIFLIIGITFVTKYITFYNKANKLKVKIENNWSEVENQYKRRYDLIPNLVQTVKGYAEHEKQTFQAVTEARSKVGGVINISKDILDNPELFQKYQRAQNSLANALQRLMVVKERYPELKANQNFLRLQDELAGTENRIAVARKRFNESVSKYNELLVVFPNNFYADLANMEKAEFFKAPEESKEAPKVEF